MGAFPASDPGLHQEIGLEIRKVDTADIMSIDPCTTALLEPNKQLNSDGIRCRALQSEQRQGGTLPPE